MELGRFSRALRDRWVLVIALGALGLVAAIALPMIRREGGNSFQAVAPVQFELSPDNDGNLSAPQLTDALASAQVAAQSLIAEDVLNRSITADTSSGQLNFVAIAPTTNEASEVATALRDAYLNADPQESGDVEGLIAAVEEEARRLNDELAALGTPDEAITSQHQFLDLQLQQLRDRLLQLAVLKITADTELLETYEAEEEKIEQAVADLTAQKEALPPLESPDPGVAFRRVAIQRRLDALVVEYERLYLLQIGVTGGGTSLPVSISDLTPPPPSPLLNGLIGLLVGVALAGVAIAVDAAARHPVWVADDLSLPVLGELPARKLYSDVSRVWYDRESRHPRKHAIQALRAAVEGRLPARSVSIAIAGIRSGTAMVEATALDLGVSFANAGWKVLVVDAELDSGPPIAELGGVGPSLSQVLQHSTDDPDGMRQAAKEAIERASTIRPNLTVIPAGTDLDSGADALSGLAFQIFLDEAATRHDLVLTLGGDLQTPAGQVLLQRTDYGVLCLVPGRISSNLVEDLVEELRDRGVAFLGAVFLHRRGTTSGGAIRSIEVVDAPPVERISVARLLQSERASSRNPQAPRGDRPGGRAPNLPPKPARPKATSDRAPTGDSRTLFEQLQGTEPSEMQDRMLATLESAERGAYEELATHLVNLISTLMTQPSAKSGFSRLAVEAAGSGFLPLYEVKGFDSVGTVLAAEFRSQLGAKLGSRFVDESSLALSQGAVEGLLTLDQWAARDYFVRHMQLHDYQPLVWHLTSRNGTVQVLVDAARLDRDAIEILRATLVGQTIETLERTLKAAVRGGRAEVVEQLGVQLTDARTFDISLGWLFEGTSPNARLVYPSLLPNQQPRGWNPIWTEGVKPNIAPLQRLGLLAAPVLTDDELRALRPAG